MTKEDSDPRDGEGRSAPGAEAPEATDADRRAALAELARWAVLAPAVAVLIEPGTSRAYPG